MAQTKNLKAFVINGLTRLALDIEEASDQFGKAMRPLLDERLGGLTVPEFHFLAAVSEVIPANGVTLARRLGMTRGGVSKMAGRLQAKKLIEVRKPEGDKKSLCYTLTDEGERVVHMHNALHNLAEDILWERLQDYSKEDLEFFGHMLVRVSAALSEANGIIEAESKGIFTPKN